MGLFPVSHYKQIEQVGETFSHLMALPYNITFDLSSNGDKCYQYKEVGEEAGVEFYQLCMVYLMSYHQPYSKTCRQTDNGFVDMRDWLKDMLNQPHVRDALNKSIYCEIKE